VKTYCLYYIILYYIILYYIILYYIILYYIIILFMFFYNNMYNRLLRPSFGASIITRTARLISEKLERSFANFTFTTGTPNQPLVCSYAFLISLLATINIVLAKFIVCIACLIDISYGLFYDHAYIYIPIDTTTSATTSSGVYSVQWM
jgi:hypothetical protein